MELNIYDGAIKLDIAQNGYTGLTFGGGGQTPGNTLTRLTQQSLANAQAAGVSQWYLFKQNFAIQNNLVFNSDASVTDTSGNVIIAAGTIADFGGTVNADGSATVNVPNVGTVNIAPNGQYVIMPPPAAKATGLTNTQIIFIIAAILLVLLLILF